MSLPVVFKLKTFIITGLTLPKTFIITGLTLPKTFIITGLTLPNVYYHYHGDWKILLWRVNWKPDPLSHKIY